VTRISLHFEQLAYRNDKDHARFGAQTQCVRDSADESLFKPYGLLARERFLAAQKAARAAVKRSLRPIRDHRHAPAGTVSPVAGAVSPLLAGTDDSGTWRYRAAPSRNASR
jgi:hypothetical protein